MYYEELDFYGEMYTDDGDLVELSEVLELENVTLSVEKVGESDLAIVKSDRIYIDGECLDSDYVLVSEILIPIDIVDLKEKGNSILKINPNGYVNFQQCSVYDELGHEQDCLLGTFVEDLILERLAEGIKL